MFGVETVNPLLLKPLLRVRVVGRDGGWQDRRHYERQDVQAVQENLLDGALTLTTTNISSGVPVSLRVLLPGPPHMIK